MIVKRTASSPRSSSSQGRCDGMDIVKEEASLQDGATVWQLWAVPRLAMLCKRQGDHDRIIVGCGVEVAAWPGEFVS